MPSFFLLAAALTLSGSGPKPASIRVDTSKVVDVAAWAKDARRTVEQWYPKIVEVLGSAPEKPPAIRLVFAPTEGVAGTSGAAIHINTDWIMRHPEDRGMVVHELVHVIQAYPKYDPGWLVEAIADYVRWWLYEPRPTGVPRSMMRASYRDSYRTAAAFLAHVEHGHPGTIKGLNDVLRKGAYADDTFEKLTGSGLEELWTDFARDWDSGEALKALGKSR